ncbi:MBL fold metallo-hydrolase [Kribbella sandramycini]|uniref:Glyoxylase-like metal-dependent hydrolase (Beta-lactamase superfamily II) n=1 Tax=Kribbella sandramycini TaxID=60450 RepID=A0A7Y4P056_9ACTN|nr:MBL fold metallo-hydrolase [Kribbella sandramycini]MBB6569387.1 glyoxylase-like metal-dependent hydrolase (beta-lactamase superfamily II) [Kribbella sandramycini]NOL40775.1 MBL fold metallo-hydrolase [Kribbella sandramycini]
MATFPPEWDDGTDPASAPHQVHWYDERTAIIRQALRTNFEGPFLYLLLGAERALLLDTGTGHVPLRPLVESLLTGQELIVAHTHAHRDHVGGDAEFDQVVGHSAAEVAAYFGISAWPDAVGAVELGDRRLEVIAIPGHQGADIAVYDATSRLLFTGDSLYPGRLYVADWAAFRASVSRLERFVAAGKPVDWILGAHIELTDRPGVDYAMGAARHEGEHVLQLAPGVLAELAAVLGPEPERIVRDEFIVYPV